MRISDWGKSIDAFSVRGGQKKREAYSNPDILASMQKR